MATEGAAEVSASARNAADDTARRREPRCGTPRKPSFVALLGAPTLEAAGEARPGGTAPGAGLVTFSSPKKPSALRRHPNSQFRYLFASRVYTLDSRVVTPYPQRRPGRLLCNNLLRGFLPPRLLPCLFPESPSPKQDLGAVPANLVRAVPVNLVPKRKLRILTRRIPV